MSKVSFLFFGRDQHPLPTGRTGKLVFAHTAIMLEDLVFDCELRGNTVWIPNDVYFSKMTPFIAFHFEWDKDIHRLTSTLQDGLPYSLRNTAIEIGRSVVKPQAVNCVWGGREVLRRMGMECNARTPDELYGQVVRIADIVQEAGVSLSGLRGRGIELPLGGLKPDSVFNREGRRATARPT